MSAPYKIGTVETLRVKSSGRSLYVTIDKETCTAFGIEAGDILTVKILEGRKPEESEEA